MKVAFAIDWIICNFFLLFPWTLLLLVNNMLILKPTIASKIKLFLLFLFSSKLAVNFDLVTYLYIFCSIPNGRWRQSKEFDMLLLSVKRHPLNSVSRIKFKMFLQDFLCFKVLFVFSKKSSLTWIPWAPFDLEHIFEGALPKRVSKSSLKQLCRFCLLKSSLWFFLKTQLRAK